MPSSFGARGTDPSSASTVRGLGYFTLSFSTYPPWLETRLSVKEDSTFAPHFIIRGPSTEFSKTSLSERALFLNWDSHNECHLPLQVWELMLIRGVNRAHSFMLFHSGAPQGGDHSSSGFLVFFFFFLFKESDYNKVPITEQLQRSKEMINAASPVPGTQKLFHQLLSLSYFWPSLSFHLLKEASWSVDV